MNRMLLILIVVCATSFTALAEPSDDQATILSIQNTVAVVREKPFKIDVPIADQAVDAFAAYLDAELAKQIPDELAADYDAVVRAVGLYNGPVIEDFRAMMKSVMLSQAGAYYDPVTDAFYVVMHSLPDMMFRTVAAHEITHGLQDQYFDLEAYMGSPAAGLLNDDQLYARTSVVEGEATYVMTLFSMYDMMGVVPDRAMLGPAIAMQAGMSTDQLKSLMTAQAGGEIAEEMGADLSAAMDAMDDIPAFIMETMVGSYMKGCAFVFDVQEAGWGAVDSLYENPPVSTEQILHPEKYAAGETYADLADPADAARDGGPLDDWRLLRSNALGELQWRIVFAEHGQGDIAQPLAAGWDGDRYAVFERDGEILMAMTTHWDTEDDAMDFEAGYYEVQGAKGLAEDAGRLIARDGRFVAVVEGGDAGLTAEVMAFMRTANGD